MVFLILLLIVIGGFFHFGRVIGALEERRRHGRAVKEATSNITSIAEWPEGWRTRATVWEKNHPHNDRRRP
jgi:hypothetical protein